MKKLKANSRIVRLTAFMLIATVLLCVVGFSADGWQSMNKTEGNSDKAVQNSGDVDENIPLPAPTVKYYDYLTGEEISEDTFMLRKTAFVVNSQAPLYGISAADLVIEFPTEASDGRMLVFTKCLNNLDKIGSIAPTRDYISSMTASFGGILVADGCDSSSKSTFTGNFLNLAEAAGYSYTDYTGYSYSNYDLIKAGIAKNAFSTHETTSPTLPYKILKGENYLSRGTLNALNLTFNFSESSASELTYSSETKSYILSKNGSVIKDLLYDREITYKNVFALFSDSVTYESEKGSELVMDTTSGGKGYYIRDGLAQEITWKALENGGMLFTDENGEILTVGSGKTYIGFMKSSQLSDFKIQ